MLVKVPPSPDHGQFDCLFDRLIMVTSKTALQLRITDFICGESAPRRKALPRHDVVIKSTVPKGRGHYSDAIMRAMARVSNHQLHHCLLNHLLSRRSKKTSKLCVTSLLAGNSPQHKWPVTRKMFPSDDVIMLFHLHHPRIKWFLKSIHLTWTIIYDTVYKLVFT